MVTWPFQRLSDLQLGDQKVTLSHLEIIFWLENYPYEGVWLEVIVTIVNIVRNSWFMTHLFRGRKQAT